MKTGRIKDGYGTIQRDVMTMKINIYSKAVYCHLVSYAGEKVRCYPSLKTICSDLDISKPTVIKAIKELISVGLLVADKKKTALGEHENNVYYPMYIMDENVVNEIDNPDKQIYNCSKSDLPPVVNDVDTKINSSKINIEDNNVNNNDLFNGFGLKETKKINEEKKFVLFKNSPEYAIDSLIARLKTFPSLMALTNVDYEYYHAGADAWSKSKNKKSADWAATIRNFMLRDLKLKKLVTTDQNVKIKNFDDMVENWNDI